MKTIIILAAIAVNCSASKPKPIFEMFVRFLDSNIVRKSLRDSLIPCLQTDGVPLRTETCEKMMESFVNDYPLYVSKGSAQTVSFSGNLSKPLFRRYAPGYHLFDNGNYNVSAIYTWVAFYADSAKDYPWAKMSGLDNYILEPFKVPDNQDPNELVIACHASSWKMFYKRVSESLKYISDLESESIGSHRIRVENFCKETRIAICKNVDFVDSTPYLIVESEGRTTYFTQNDLRKEIKRLQKAGTSTEGELLLMGVAIKQLKACADYRKQGW